MAYNYLFSPIKIGSVEIPNRIALMPVGVLSPRMMNQDASYTKDGADYYIEWAKGGAGLVITGMAPVPPGEFLPSIVNDPAAYTKNMKYLADGVHQYGSKVFVQISAMSGRSGTAGGPAPSNLPNVWDPSQGQREMTVEEIHQYVEWFAIGAKVARMLQEAGYDMLDCDNGTYDAWYRPHPPVYMPKALNLEDVALIKKEVDIPVICAGRFDDPALADRSIAEGRIDMMGMGRALLADPEIARKFQEDRLDDIRPCISCHFGCLARIVQFDFEKMALKDISCALNPRCGMENHYNITEAETKKKIAVAGGGIAGMEAARVCALRGHEVDLYEKNDVLGGIFIAAAA